MLDSLITLVTAFTNDAPWWIYVLAILIPIFFLFAIRESYCWFNKISGVNKRLAKLDTTLSLILEELREKNQERDNKQTKSKIIKGSNIKDPIIKDPIIKDTKFSLDEKEEFKLK